MGKLKKNVGPQISLKNSPKEPKRLKRIQKLQIRKSENKKGYKMKVTNVYE